MTTKVSVSVEQELVFDGTVRIVKCPDKEFADLNCVKIGENYFLPSVEWMKYIPPEDYADDGAGEFEPVEGSEWETIHHAIKGETTRVG